MDDEKSVVAEWYKGRSIFITGGTGFMGKVLVEKLLYSCELQTLYILMRPKRGKSPEERLKDMFSIPLFERIRSTKPEVLKKVVPISGEISLDKMGISPEDKKKIVDNVSVVFHFAATLRLEAQLADSVEMNTAGTQRVLELSREIKNLIAFIHLSTAFCSPDIDVFEEKVYESPVDPHEVIRTVKWMKKEALIKATPELIKPHPNTYTYTKRLGETLVAKEAKHMRVAIVRPSIVTPTAVEPFPGWVDSLNGPTGVLTAAGKGVLRIMVCNGENSAHTVPVDIAINATIVIAWKLGSAAKQPEEIPVYNLTNNEVLKVTWYDVLNLGKVVGREFPMEMQVWYPDGTITDKYWVYFIWSLFVHWLPAILIDCLLFIFRQERIMIRVQKKIYHGLALLQFFTTREWVFKSQKFLNLSKELTPIDNKIYAMDFLVYPIEEYMKHCAIGSRVYCMKEKLSSLTRCRIQQKVLYVVDKLFKLLLLYGIFCLAWSYSDTVKHVTHVIASLFEGSAIQATPTPDSS